MKVMAFSARNDESVFFDQYAKQLNIDLTKNGTGLSIESVDMTKGYEGLSCVGTCDLSEPVISKLAENGVKYVALRTVGYDNVDLDAARKHGIRVSNAGYSPFSVANYTVMLMLMCMRKGLYIMLRSHTADMSLGSARGMEMQNMTVGVIGTGRIGKAVIQNLQGFGCKVLAYDIYQDPNLKGAEYVSLDELYAQSDIVTLHTFLSKETRHMINADAIDKMKQGVILINAARGDLVDTKALIKGIEDEKIGGAGIDCFEGEENVIRADHSYDRRVTNHDYIILKSFQNTVVTPHVAFFTDQAVSDMVECSLSSLSQFVSGEDVPLEVINKH